MEALGNSRKTQMMVMAGVMVAVLTAAVFMTQPALAQLGTNSTQSNNSTQPQQQQGQQNMPQLKGSVNIRDAAKAFLRDNVKVSFDSAVSTAQKAVSNGTVIGGQLTVAQGYLVYSFKVANFDAGTSQIVIVDAGNGSVLYTSGNMPLHFGGVGGGHGWCTRGHSFGHHGMSWSNMAPSPSSSINSESSDNFNA